MGDAAARDAKALIMKTVAFMLELLYCRCFAFWCFASDCFDRDDGIACFAENLDFSSSYVSLQILAD